MKIFFYSILSSLLYIIVLLFGVKPACMWGFHQPRVPKIQ
ncbi:cyclic lactone autoinducer peptide [Ruminiclostridium cellobioparum]